MTAQKRLVAAANRRRVGERVRVLVDGPSAEHPLVAGRPAGDAGAGDRPGRLPLGGGPGRLPARRARRRRGRGGPGLRSGGARCRPRSTRAGFSEASPKRVARRRVRVRPRPSGLSSLAKRPERSVAKSRDILTYFGCRGLETTGVGPCPLFVFWGDRGAPRSTFATLAERVARTYGLEIFDVQFRREARGLGAAGHDRPRRVSPTPRRSPARRPTRWAWTTASTSAATSSALLDVEDADRSARTRSRCRRPASTGRCAHAGDYRRFRGRLAQVVTAEPVDGQTHFRGPAPGHRRRATWCSRYENGRQVRVPLALVSRARLEVEF